MAVAFIAWGRFPAPKQPRQHITVPAPSTDQGKPWLADFVAAHAERLSRSFDVVQWPPISMAQGGTGAGCDGYGVAQRWNLGYPEPTRYGPLQSLMRAVAALRAYGVESYGDLVLHQILGPEDGGPGASTYLGANGVTRNGRGATSPGWFRGGLGTDDPVPPFCRQDDVPDRASDQPFGREVSYQHCWPPGVTTRDAIDLLHWMTERVGFSGYRFDDVKGTYAPAVAEIMRSTSLPFYAEYFDGNPANLDRWASGAPLLGRSAVADFTLHYRIQAACNGFDAREFETNGAGYWQWNAGLSVGFVENPDTDLSEGQQVIFNKGIAYAYLLTLPLRLALVYGKDYFPDAVWPGAYGLRDTIDNLCWIHRTFAVGAYQTRWVDRDVHAATRDGKGGELGWSGGLLTAVNFNTLSARTITCGTTFGPHCRLHDYSGHHPDIWTDADGQATFTIPSNAWSAGDSYVCFAPGGVVRQYPVRSLRTTQVFTGDATLDVMPARNGADDLPQRLFCRARSLVRVTLAGLSSAMPPDSAMQLVLLGPQGAELARTHAATGEPLVLDAAVGIGGWHTLRLIAQGLPVTGINFQLAVDYLGG